MCYGITIPESPMDQPFLVEQSTSGEKQNQNETAPFLKVNKIIQSLFTFSSNCPPMYTQILFLICEQGVNDNTRKEILQSQLNELRV